jgi:hypothetical protein
MWWVQSFFASPFLSYLPLLLFFSSALFVDEGREEGRDKVYR